MDRSNQWQPLGSARARFIVFDSDATRQAARQRALPCGPEVPPAKRRLDAVCAPGSQGRKRAEVVRVRTTVLQMHTRQWVGTYVGRGNGDSRGELALALQAIRAEVTGIDFAEQAIAIAQSLSQGLHLEATFLWSDLYHLPNVLHAAGAFDIVYIAYGVIGWLPDLRPWGKMIAHYLKPDGFFYLAEGHPFIWRFDENSPEFKLGYPYFSREPIKDESSGSYYAEKEAKLKQTTPYSWNHPLSEIFDALLSAGLRIDFFHEHQFCAWECLTDMEEGEDRLMRFKDLQKRGLIPLAFSLKATKNGELP